MEDSLAGAEHPFYVRVAELAVQSEPDMFLQLSDRVRVMLFGSALEFLERLAETDTAGNHGGEYTINNAAETVRTLPRR